MEIVRCSECGEAVEASELEAHVAAAHLDYYPISCAHCRLHFPSQSAAARHSSLKHPQLPPRLREATQPRFEQRLSQIIAASTAEECSELKAKLSSSATGLRISRRLLRGARRRSFGSGFCDSKPASDEEPQLPETSATVPSPIQRESQESEPMESVPSDQLANEPSFTPVSKGGKLDLNRDQLKPESPVKETELETGGGGRGGRNSPSARVRHYYRCEECAKVLVGNLACKHVYERHLRIPDLVSCGHCHFRRSYGVGDIRRHHHRSHPNLPELIRDRRSEPTVMAAYARLRRRCFPQMPTRVSSRIPHRPSGGASCVRCGEPVIPGAEEFCLCRVTQSKTSPPPPPPQPRHTPLRPPPPPAAFKVPVERRISTPRRAVVIRELRCEGNFLNLPVKAPTPLVCLRLPTVPAHLLPS